MTLRIELTPHALEDLSALDPTIARRISAKLDRLAETFHTLTPEVLTGRLKGLYKLRVGDWRVLYTIDSADSVLTVHVLAHRSKVYK